MNIDTIILLVLGAFFLIGFVRGFIREVGAFLGFFVSLWVAGHYYTLLIPSIKPSLSQWPMIAEPLSVVLAFFGLFVVSQILFGFVIKLLDFVVRRLSPVPFLKTTNRLAGAVIGVVEGVLFLSAILFVFTNFPVSKEISGKIANSRLATTIQKASGFIVPLLPNVSSLSPFSQGLPDKKFIDDVLKNSNFGSFDMGKVDPSKIDLKALGIDEKQLPPEVKKLLEQYQKQGEKK